MEIITCTQGEPEWFLCRAGIPTASGFDKIITTTGEPSKQRQKYMWKLAGEKASGTFIEGYKSAAMEHGIVTESEARSMYELITGATVEQVGFCLGEGFGCSPDGLVGEDGGLEIKCPQVDTHVEYLMKGELPTTYFQQVQGSLFVTGRKWWDFMSYFTGLKPLIVRVYPDLAFHGKLKNALIAFNAELNQIVEKIKG